MGKDTTKETIRLLLVDDQPAFRAGLHSFLQSNPTIEIVAETDGQQNLFQLLEQTHPHVILLASSVFADEVDSLSEFYSSANTPTIIVMVDKVYLPYILRLLAGGVTGVATRDVAAAELSQMIECVFQQKRALSLTLVNALVSHLVEQEISSPGCSPMAIESLTSREGEVFALVAQGLSNQDIAEQLSLSLSTVKSHVSNILSKLEVDNRAAVVRLALGQQVSQQKSPKDETA